jgi:hypothetical protein
MDALELDLLRMPMLSGNKKKPTAVRGKQRAFRKRTK